MKACYVTLFVFAALTAGAQTKTADIKYRRSSLYTLIIDDAGLVKADVIKTDFVKAPIPEKFNDHTLAARSFDSGKYALTAEEKGKVEKEGKGKTMLKGAASSASGGLVDTTNTKYLPQIIDKYLTQNHVARDMVAKWFNRDAKGGFNMNLIGERGSYNASEMQINIAKKSARGLASIADAGAELIGNTFVVVTRLNYISKKAIYDAAQSVGGSALGSAASPPICCRMLARRVSISDFATVTFNSSPTARKRALRIWKRSCPRFSASPVSNCI